MSEVLNPKIIPSNTFLVQKKYLPSRVPSFKYLQYFLLSNLYKNNSFFFLDGIFFFQISIKIIPSSFWAVFSSSVSPDNNYPSSIFFMTTTCNIFLSVDVGGSQTKIIYQFPGWDKPLCLLMSPGVEQITKSDLKRYYDQSGWLGAPSSEQQAWVEWKGSIFVVGDFTSEFAPQDRIFERKYENALYKVLAAIGVILSKHNVKSKRRKNADSQSLKVNLYIGLLLPWNEYNDRKRFQEQLELMLRSLKFRGQSWNVNLCAFECRPEGGGLAAIRIKQKGLEWLQENKVVVLMFGHRNVTAIYFDGGAIKRGDSPLLGFSTFLDDVCKRVSGLERDKLAASIFETIDYSEHHIYHDECTVHPKWKESKAIAALATAKDETLRKLEKEDIVKAI